jgi:sterol desaturase/sphingolipid hydroxylase (fatty acid hydroxylase superfamily)
MEEKSMKTTKIPTWLSALLVGGTCVTLLWLEHRQPLRSARASKLRRTGRNLALATTSAMAVQLLEQPLARPLAALVARRRWGLLQQFPLPPWLHVVLAFTLLDYTLYLWHVLVHRVSCLWRWHQVHHVDRDMDVSTALRFHGAEMVLSVPWRLAQILCLGVSPLAFSVWQTGTLLMIMFHHANVWLSDKTERWLGRILVTPRLHTIHHSMVPEETNSNWSNGLAIWDWLHGTRQDDVPTQEVTIGVPAYQQPQDVTLGKLLAMPFHTQRPSWRLPNGKQPARRGTVMIYKDAPVETT